MAREDDHTDAVRRPGRDDVARLLADRGDHTAAPHGDVTSGPAG
ncbi:MAG TPA: hypothetical protein VGI05_03445 [Streptosporangiaceae bacterium]